MWQIVGHKWAVDLLRRSLFEDRVGHAYLITGPPQIGKTTLARTFARALNCTHPDVDARPCGACRACRLVGADTHPDVQIIEPDGAYLKIAQVRALQQQVALSPVEGRRKVYILREMERATPEAANALLKTLEEPPAHVVLLLTASEPEALLPTIVSRCQPIPLRPTSRRTVEQALADRWGAAPAQAALLAGLSGGRLGWAVNVCQDPAALDARTRHLDTLQTLLSQDRAERFAFAAKLSRSTALQKTLNLWLTWWRDALLLSHGSQTQLTHRDREAELERVAQSLSPEEIRRVVEALCRAIDALDRHANSQLTAEVLMLALPTIKH